MDAGAERERLGVPAFGGDVEGVGLALDVVLPLALLYLVSDRAQGRAPAPDAAPPAGSQLRA